MTVNGIVLAGDQPLVEVFITSDLPVAYQRNKVELYTIDGIKRIEQELSGGLTADSDAARHQATKRITQLDEGQKQQVQRAAIGLSKALQYGIDRYPAIVFNGEAVVYGVTDLTKALDFNEAWQQGRSR